jgi:predicted alpha/beta-fold hydrolase
MTRLSGHYWTIVPNLAARVSRPMPPYARHFVHRIDDPTVGQIDLTGRLGPEPDDTDELLVVIHGLGGSAQSTYTILAAQAASQAGIACLRWNMRGADRRGADYYHAGLTSDLASVLRAPSLARYRRIYLLGYSLGGHLTLRFLAEGAAPRVLAGAAVCPPIDLAISADRFDRPHAAVYRKDLLRGLKETYRAVAAKRDVPVSTREVERISRIREWDDIVIAPRFGFDGVDDYYARASVAPILGGIRQPTTVVTTRHDPIVAADAAWPYLEQADQIRTVFLDRGGHVGFPRETDLALGHSGSVEAQLLAWMRTHAS